MKEAFHFPPHNSTLKSEERKEERVEEEEESINVVEERKLAHPTLSFCTKSRAVLIPIPIES